MGWEAVLVRIEEVEALDLCKVISVRMSNMILWNLRFHSRLGFLRYMFQLGDYLFSKIHFITSFVVFRHCHAVSSIIAKEGQEIRDREDEMKIKEVKSDSAVSMKRLVYLFLKWRKENERKS